MKGTENPSNILKNTLQRLESTFRPTLKRTRAHGTHQLASATIFPFFSHSFEKVVAIKKGLTSGGEIGSWHVQNT